MSALRHPAASVATTLDPSPRPSKPTRRRPPADPAQRVLGPKTAWWALLGCIEDEYAAGWSRFRQRELDLLELLVRQSDQTTGLLVDRRGRPLNSFQLAAIWGVSMPTFHRALERLRDKPSHLPPHPGRGPGKAWEYGWPGAVDNTRERRETCPPRLEPLGLVAVEYTRPNFAGCETDKRRCDARWQQLDRARRKRGDRIPPLGCIHHHGRVDFRLLARTPEDIAAAWERLGDDGVRFPVRRQQLSKRSVRVEHPGGRPWGGEVEHPGPGPVRESGEPGSSALSSAFSAVPLYGSPPPLLGSIGGPQPDETITRQPIAQGLGFRHPPPEVPSAAPPTHAAPPRATSASRPAPAPSPPAPPPAHAPSSQAALPAPQKPAQAPDAAKPGGGPRRGFEGGRAKAGPASTPTHAAAQALDGIVQAWAATTTPRYPNGLPLLNYPVQALERLVEAGAPIEQLELVALGVKYGQGLCAYAREQADHPMAVAFADVERVLRYAAAGQKARDALAAQAWREERHRKVQAARQRAIADGADAPAAPRDVGALARFALEGGGLPPSSSPGGAAPAPRAARAAAQLFAEAPLPPPPKSSAAPPIDPKRAFFYGQLAMAECELASRAEKDAKKDALRAEYRAEFNEDMEDER